MRARDRLGSAKAATRRPGGEDQRADEMRDAIYRGDNVIGDDGCRTRRDLIYILRQFHSLRLVSARRSAAQRTTEPRRGRRYYVVDGKIVRFDGMKAE